MRVLLLDGKPQELAEAEELLGWLRNWQTPTDVESANESAAESQLSDEVLRFIHQRSAGNESRERLVKDFVEQAARRGDVDVEIGKSRSTSDGRGNYLMLRATGPRRLGAIAYVTPGPGTVSFRLDRRYARDSPFAQELGVKAQNPYQVFLRVHSPSAVAEALRLAGLALDNVRDGGSKSAGR